MTNAFPEGTQRLADLVQSVTLDIPALSRPLKSCEISRCRGTCCHDGVYLSGEEADVVRKLVLSERETLRQLGGELPSRVVVYGKFRDLASGPKTAVRPSPMRQLVEDYPAHFEETNCVFLLSDSRCVLQALAIEKQVDPWFYKPFTCWIHPLSFTKTSAGEDLLTIYGRENDPHCVEGYNGFSSQTHCGRVCAEPDAQPAYQVLEAELSKLGEIGNRDLIAEIRGQC